MGGFNLPNEGWAQLPGISAENFCATEKVLTAQLKCTQLIPEPTHKGCKTFDLVFTNYDESKPLNIGKHSTFSDLFTMSVGIPENSEKLDTQTTLKQYSLIVSE